MPRFVVLIHDHPALHWDFMLEKEATLRTWRLAQQPNDSGQIDAERLPDHRLAYLDYEGPVSDNRGSVRRFDHGEYVLIAETDEVIAVELRGTVLVGKASLERNEGSDAWRFSFMPAMRAGEREVSEPASGGC